MDQDLLFRPVLVAGFLLVVAVTAWHRIKAATREPLDRKQEGAFILWTLRPVAGLAWGSIILFMINPAWMSWASSPLPEAVRWTGAAICVFTTGLLYWTLSNLGPNFTDTVVTRRAATLVTRGPYRWVRHPFYGCFALLFTGVALLMANWFVLLTGTIVMLLLMSRTRREEANLLARFGEPYRLYQSCTGRFLPRIFRLKADATR